jgi:hypothetical protein
MKRLMSVFLFVLLVGCDTGTSDLSISTILWELGDDGFTQLYTNDPQYYNWSFWHFCDNNNTQNTYEIECKKMGGSLECDYGMLFGASNLTQDQYYCVGITSSGYYIVWNRNGDEYTTIKDWTRSDKIYTGYDRINSIKVTQAGTVYTVFLNGTQVYQFDDATITGNRIGYYVRTGIEGAEEFPNSPVDVRFKQK